MPTFQFASAQRLLFGPGRARELPDLVAGLGTRVLICTGSRPERHHALFTSITQPTTVFSVRGEPTVEMARQALAGAVEHRTDVVVAIGGGSAIDLGKTVAMLLGNGGDPLDYLEVIGGGRPIAQPSIPFVAVPTTAGTGAEMTANAVLRSPEHQRKASLRSHLMLATVALVDPLLTVDCPPAVTASSGLDALTQCLEPFVTPRATPLSDGFCREGLAAAGRSLRRAFDDGSDVDARTDMSLCSVLGGMALANSGLGAVHGFAGVIGGIIDAPHGSICAALLAPTTEINVRALTARAPDSPALARYAEAARILTGDSAAGIQDGIDWIRETLQQLRLPGLGGLGMADVDRVQVVRESLIASSMKANPIALTPAELEEILVLAQ